MHRSAEDQGLAEYPGLVPASWVRWVQAIALDLADIEDSLFAVWQMLRHNRRLASRPVWRKRISDTAPEKGSEYLDIQARPRPDGHSATAKQYCPSSSTVARHLRYSGGPAGVCGFRQDSRSHAASLWLPTKNIENNPMQSSRRSPARTLWANT